MTKLKAGFLGAVVVAGVTASLMIQHNARENLRQQDQISRQQSTELARQQAENERLTRLVSNSADSRNNLEVLTNLRDQVAGLQQQAKILAVRQEENRRWRARVAASGNPAISILEEREKAEERIFARLNYTKQWLLAFRLFADKNQDQFPDGFDVARPFLSPQATANTNCVEAQFELLFHGRLNEITNASNFVVFREKLPVRSFEGKWARAYGFADGHSEIANSPDGSFKDWEDRHALPAAYPP